MVPHAFPHCTTRPTRQHFCRCRLRTSPTFSSTLRSSPHPLIHPTLAALDNPSLTSVVQHHEHGENKKFIGRHSTSRPADDVTAAILHQRYCLVPCTIDPGGQLGPLTSSLLRPRKRHPTAILPPSHARSIRGYPLLVSRLILLPPPSPPGPF
jgi:hypothetical protein